MSPSVTGFPESLGGRVKTLHPGVHAGLLADLRLEDHERSSPSSASRRSSSSWSTSTRSSRRCARAPQGDDVVEQIDIGGPAMVRASAKNFANVAIVVSPESYPAIIEAVRAGGTSLAQRRELAARAFAHTARVRPGRRDLVRRGDARAAPTCPQHLTIKAERLATLRYGENSHQRAAIYTRIGGHGIAQATQLQGKEMSYNNYVDADAALRAAFDMVKPAVAIIKHANPCGIAVAAPNALDPIASAHLRAHECDPVSAFGGVIAANRTVTLKMAENLRDIFTEVIVAPDFEPAALEVFKLKKNLRVLQLPGRLAAGAHGRAPGVGRPAAAGRRPLPRRHRVGREGLAAGLGRAPGRRGHDEPHLRVEGLPRRQVERHRAGEELRDGRHRHGPGQPRRLLPARGRARRRPRRGIGRGIRCVLPVRRRTRRCCIDAGISAIIQPGGSVRDDEVIAAAKDAGVTMFFTGERHFFH